MNHFFNRIFGFALSLVGFAADVVTVTTGTAGTAGNVAADLQTYFSAKLLEVAELNTILNQFGEATPIPSNSSKTIQFVREEKFAVSATPTQLTEGIAPDAVAHHVSPQLQAAELYDQLIFNTLNAGTSVYYPNGKVSDATTTATDTVAYNDLVALDALLNDAGGRPMDSGDYVLVCASQVYAALLKDPDYKASHQLSSPDKIWRGEVDQLAGFRVVRSNAPGFAATTQATSGAANKLYSSFAIAKSAYQISDLQNLKVYVVAPGGQADPLQQSRKMG
ncbi:unnamed protein product [Sphagnum jensenii]